MKKKSEIKLLALLGGLTVLALALFLAFAGREEQSAGEPGALTGIAVDSAVLDLGTISMAEGIKEEEIQLKNERAENLRLIQIETSCHCTQASAVVGSDQSPYFGMSGHGANLGWVREIGQGEEFGVRVRFDPTAHGPAGVGKIERTVRLWFSDPEGYLDLTLRANVVP